MFLKRKWTNWNIKYAESDKLIISNVLNKYHNSQRSKYLEED